LDVAEEWEALLGDKSVTQQQVREIKTGCYSTTKICVQTIVAEFPLSGIGL
jgi:hypothetical protein